jgi:hypothetical protein
MRCVVATTAAGEERSGEVRASYSGMTVIRCNRNPKSGVSMTPLKTRSSASKPSATK